MIVFPPRNLGPGEPWGREFESSLSGLQVNSDRISSFSRSENRAFSAASDLLAAQSRQALDQSLEVQSLIQGAQGATQDIQNTADLFYLAAQKAATFAGNTSSRTSLPVGQTWTEVSRYSPLLESGFSAVYVVTAVVVSRPGYNLGVRVGFSAPGGAAMSQPRLTGQTISNMGDTEFGSICSVTETWTYASSAPVGDWDQVQIATEVIAGTPGASLDRVQTSVTSASWRV